MKNILFFLGFVCMVLTNAFGQAVNKNNINEQKEFRPNVKKAINSKLYDGVSLMRKAETFEINGKLDSALSCFVLANKAFIMQQDTSKILHVNLRLVEFYRKHNQLSAAKNLIDDTQKYLATYNASQDYLARLYNRMAAVESESSGDINKVLEYSLKCIAIAKSIGDSSLLASSLNELGFRFENMFFHQDTNGGSNRYFFDKALENYLEALGIYKAKDMYRSQLTVLINLARLFHHDDQPLACIDYAKQGIAIATDNFKEYDKRELYQYLGDDLRKIGQFEKAIEAKEKYYSLYLSYIEENHQKDFLELQTKYDVAKKESRISEQELSLIKGEKKRVLLIVALITFLVLMVVLTYLYKLSQRKNKQLNELAKENAFLVEESNHRTKNNLQLISALIHRELIKKDDEFEINELKKISSLIESISSLHKQLYLNKEKDKIVLSDFLYDVFDNLNDLLEENEVELKLNFAPIIVDNKLAGYIGILLTELCINSLKHAFGQAKSKLINCTILETDETLMLSYKDNGVGVKPGTSIDLVDLLCNQLKADFQIDTKPSGFEITVKMKL